MLNPRPRLYRAQSKSATRPSGPRCGSTFRPGRFAGAVVALAVLVAGCTGGAAKIPVANQSTPRSASASAATSAPTATSASRATSGPTATSAGTGEPVQSGPSTTPGAGAGTSSVPVVPSTPPARSPDHSVKNLDWPFYGNDQGGMRFQDVDQINASNVGQLTPAWIMHMHVGKPATSLETQPIIVGGTLFASSPHDHVFALDAVTGAVKWTYSPTDMPPLFALALCCGQTNRGVAVGDGKVYIARLDDVLVALDAKTGKVAWKTRTADFHQRYSQTMAPQFVDGKVVVGSAGGEYAARGFVAAYDSKSGQQIWRFYTTKPGTWGGEAWKHGGGTVWTTPEVDPKLGLIYAHTGNPSPDINGSKRPGANLYTSSIVALEIRTGHLRWYFQEVHHDLWDYDAAQPAQLYTIKRGNDVIPVIGQAGKDGYYFDLDRRTGKPVLPVREVKVPTTPSWQHPYPTQPESGIRLVPNVVGSTPPGFGSAPMWTPPREQPLWEQPGAENSGPEWSPGAYSPRTKYAYIPSGGYSPWLYRSSPAEVNSYGSTGTPPAVPKLKTYGLFNAVDTVTGKIAWRNKTSGIVVSGTAVAGDLVFFGLDDGTYQAHDAQTGKTLWSWHSTMKGIGGANGAGAVYMVGGREYIVMPFGGNSHIRADNGATVSPLGDALIAFALPTNKPSAPRIVDATPVQVPVGAPTGVAGTPAPPASARVIEIKAHDLNYYPDHFTVKAGERVAVHVIDTGLLPVGFAVILPGRSIGLSAPLPPGQGTYFAFTAPKKPGGYTYYSSIQPDKDYASGGLITVTPN